MYIVYAKVVAGNVGLFGSEANCLVCWVESIGVQPGQGRRWKVLVCNAFCIDKHYPHGTLVWQHTIATCGMLGIKVPHHNTGVSMTEQSVSTIIPFLTPRLWELSTPSCEGIPNLQILPNGIHCQSGGTVCV